MENYTLILNEYLSPEFNLACEEYFLTQKSGAYILLWRNSRSVIIGRNQNAYAELDFGFIKNNGIRVVRRLTGGGAVFHDPGNLNFTFIFDSDGLADFREYLSPVVNFLKIKGINADFSGRNDIIAEGKKISGCAQAYSRGRTIVHGTLLFSADLSLLSGALIPNEMKLKSNGVSSVRSRVGNIDEMLDNRISVIQFRDELASFLTDSLSCKTGIITPTDEAAINRLSESRYSTFEWNIGQSPSWSMEKTGRISSGLVTFALSVRDGIISEAHIFGDYFEIAESKQLCDVLNGCVFSPPAVLSALSAVSPENIIIGLTAEKACDIIFSHVQ